MFDNLSRDPPDQSVPLAEAPLIPDPWETPSLVLEVNSAAIAGQFPREPYPLISPAGHLGVPQLSTTKPNCMQLLLEEGLKLRVYGGGKLAIQIREALALLYWVGRVTQGSPQAATTLSS